MLSNSYPYLSSFLSALSRFVQPPYNSSISSLNVAAHYDICNEMFTTFLSPDMAYSCPIWDFSQAGETLEAAQMRKLHHVIRLADIQSTDHVLEIGTGWGSFAIEAIRTTDCRLASMTLSQDQKAEAEKRIALKGLQDKIELLLCDYRALKTPDVLYDKVVSLEMVEHVGPEYLETYFGVIDRVLKAEGGIAVVQSTTIAESVSVPNHLIRCDT